MSRRRWQQGSVSIEGEVWKGRYLEDVQDEFGEVRRVHRKVTLGTVREVPTAHGARRMLQPYLARVNSINFKPRCAMTFGAVVKKWETMILPNLKPSTQRTTRSVIRRHLLPALRDESIGDLCTESVQEFAVRLTNLSGKTVRNIVITLRAILRDACDWNYLEEDAVKWSAVNRSLPKYHKAEQRYFAEEEVRRIIEWAPEPYKTFYWLLAETGMRAGEACGLRYEDVDFRTGTVQVRQSVWGGSVQNAKTEASSRVFAVSPQLQIRVRDYLHSWRPGEMRLLFATSNGTPWLPDLVVKRKLKPLLKRLGIPHGGLHAFRHFNETMMDRASVPMKVRQQRLGHADAKTTLGIYTHAITQDDQAFANQMGEILCPPDLPADSKVVQ